MDNKYKKIHNKKFQEKPNKIVKEIKNNINKEYNFYTKEDGYELFPFKIKSQI